MCIIPTYMRQCDLAWKYLSLSLLSWKNSARLIYPFVFWLSFRCSTTQRRCRCITKNSNTSSLVSRTFNRYLPRSAINRAADNRNKDGGSENIKRPAERTRHQSLERGVPLVLHQRLSQAGTKQAFEHYLSSLCSIISSVRNREERSFSLSVVGGGAKDSANACLHLTLARKRKRWCRGTQPSMDWAHVFVVSPLSYLEHALPIVDVCEPYAKSVGKTTSAQCS